MTSRPADERRPYISELGLLWCGWGRSSGRVVSPAAGALVFLAGGDGWEFRGQVLADQAEHCDGFQSVLRGAVCAGGTFVDWIQHFISGERPDGSIAAATAAGAQQGIDAGFAEGLVLRLEINIRRQPAVA